MITNEPSIKTRVILTQRRGGVIGRGRKQVTRLQVVHVEIVQPGQEFERLGNIESPNAESRALDCCPDDCACIVRGPMYCSFFEIRSSNPPLQPETE